MWRRACSRHPAQILQKKVLPFSYQTESRIRTLVSLFWDLMCLGEGGQGEVPLGNFKGNSSEAVVCVVKQGRDKDKPSSENWVFRVLWT